MLLRAKRPSLHARLSVVALALVAAACSDQNGGSITAPEDAPSRNTTSCGGPVTSLVVIPFSTTIIQTHQKQFQAIAKDAGGCDVLNASIFWYSFDNGVAQPQSSYGTFVAVKGVGVGSTSIAATTNGYTALSSVTVEPRVATSISISPEDPSFLPLNETWQFTATVRDQGNKVINLAPVTWSVDDTAIATIDQNGLLSTHAMGSTIVRATSGSAQGSTSIRVKPLVIIEGPEHVEYAGSYTYEAFPSGGDGNYTYQWSVLIQGSWTTLGTGKTQSLYIPQGTGEIFMRVDIASAGGGNHTMKYTTNGIGCGGDFCPVEP